MAGRTVDPLHVPVSVVTPAGTTIAAPMVTTPHLDAGVLERIELQIPPGHVGATGVRILLAGQQIVPWSNVAAWILGDDLLTGFDVGVQVDTGLQIVTYNTGNYPHTHYLRFVIRQAGAVTARPALQLVANDDLSSTG